MNWYTGSVSDAVQECGRRNAVFVVFVQDANTPELLGNLVNDERIANKLSTENFVAIRLSSNSESYTQFAAIYQMVPVPSIFFIWKGGAPIEIITIATKTVDELEQKVDGVLQTAGKSNAKVEIAKAPSPSPSSISNSSKGNEADVESVTKNKNQDGPSCSKATFPVAKADVSSTITKNSEIPAKPKEDLKTTSTNVFENSADMQQSERDVALKELKEKLRRERLAELTARERIRAQIAADRAEQMHRFNNNDSPVNDGASTSSAAAARAGTPLSSNAASSNADPTIARLQFRLGSGKNVAKSFGVNETLSAVRNYVRDELLSGTRTEFFLATMYPRREFNENDDNSTLTELSLAPTAVILVITRETPSVLVRSGGIINIFHTIFIAITAPLRSLLAYFKSGPSTGRVAPTDNSVNATNYGAQKKNDDHPTRNILRSPLADRPSTSSQNDSGDVERAYRRYGSNIHRLTDNRGDSDDENATWNGNSTQQQ